MAHTPTPLRLTPVADVRSIYTSQRITGYYVVRTIYKCQCCGKITDGPIGPEVMVSIDSGNAGMKLSVLLNRYKKLWPDRDPHTMLPKFRIDVREITQPVPQCDICVPIVLGEPNCITNIPVDLDLVGTIESPNEDFEKRTNAMHKAQVKGKSEGKQTRKGRSRYANPNRKETPEQLKARKERERKLDRLAAGDIDMLLEL